MPRCGPCHDPSLSPRKPRFSRRNDRRTPNDSRAMEGYASKTVNLFATLVSWSSLDFFAPLGNEVNGHNIGADDEKASHLCCSWRLSGRFYVRRAVPPRVRWVLGPSLRNATRRVRSDVRFLGQHQQWRRHASESSEVQRLCSTLGCRSRFSDCSGQIRVRHRPALEQFRSRDMERLFGRRALLRLLDRRAKLTTDLAQSIGAEYG
jgi:hypothetical protein